MKNLVGQKEKRDYSRTRTAIGLLDEAERAFMSSGREGYEVFKRVMKEEGEAIKAVGQAFYLDTKDINREEDCLDPFLIGWIRGQVKRTDSWNANLAACYIHQLKEDIEYNLSAPTLRQDGEKGTVEAARNAAFRRMRKMSRWLEISDSNLRWEIERVASKGIEK